MIREEKYHEGYCDSCGKQWNDENTFAYSDRGAVLYSMRESGYHIDGDKHYCPSCWEIGGNDEVVIKSKSK